MEGHDTNRRYQEDNKGCLYHIWTFIVVMFILWAICWFAGNLG